jgi:hypothetical protein
VGFDETLPGVDQHPPAKVKAVMNNPPNLNAKKLV